MSIDCGDLKKEKNFPKKNIEIRCINRISAPLVFSSLWALSHLSPVNNKYSTVYSFVAYDGWLCVNLIWRES